MRLHHLLGASGMERGCPALACLSSQQRMDPAAAMGRQISDQDLDAREPLLLGQRSSAAAAQTGLASG